MGNGIVALIDQCSYHKIVVVGNIIIDNISIARAIFNIHFFNHTTKTCLISRELLAVSINLVKLST